MFIVFSFFGLKGLDPDKIPQTKTDIGKILSNKSQTIFNTKIFGYDLYNFTHWLEMNDVYNFTYLEKAQFEPYYVAHRNIQFYDETYVTWGFNKLTQILDMNEVGYNMKVIPDLYMIHLNHSDIKGFKSWKFETKDARHNMKVGTSMNRLQKLPGLLTNTYYPPWLQGYTKVTVNISESGTQKLFRLNQKLKSSKSYVRALKTILVFALMVFVCIVVFYKKYV